MFLFQKGNVCLMYSEGEERESSRRRGEEAEGGVQGEEAKKQSEKRSGRVRGGSMLLLCGTGSDIYQRYFY